MKIRFLATTTKCDSTPSIILRRAGGGGGGGEKGGVKQERNGTKKKDGKGKWKKEKFKNEEKVREKLSLRNSKDIIARG